MGLKEFVLRIVSLIASATEIACALGFRDQLVGRSHECDFPPGIQNLPVCTAPKFDVHGSSRDIDDRVKSTLQNEISVYDVDDEILKNLRPDVILTQTQCEVCAVSLKDVERALAVGPASRAGPRSVEGEKVRFGSPDLPISTPRIVSLFPNCLADVWADIERVADALNCPDRGIELVAQLQSRISVIADRAAREPNKPTVACLEWLDPLMAAGNWMPELVQLAGGVNLFGEKGKHSPWMSWDDLLARDPDVIIATPCGFDLDKTRQEMATLRNKPEWGRLKAVCTGRVAITDGNQFFNRPGPRLVESLEILAEILLPQVFRFGHSLQAWRFC
ncbi:MAG: cobalamin-binding protein [Planctomycetes bacterium]|nr:cobalamin-binding protein [Planctomycetota bacterium]